MIHIDKKDSYTIPASLASTSAQDKRISYCNDPSLSPPEKHYNSKSTKKSLKAIYNNKCGYCEQKIVWFNVNGIIRPQNANSIEHYRPKASNKYNWLAYSWDNLFLACIGCNNPKDDDFPVIGTPILSARTGDIHKIHKLAFCYYFTEYPKYPHPEINYPEYFLMYTTEGDIKVNHTIPNQDADYQYFIDNCDLKREELVTARKKVYQDEFRDKYKGIIHDTSLTNVDKDIKVKGLVAKFIQSAQDETKDFLGFRRYIIKYELANDMRKIARGVI